jgi:hypothetical protein
MNGSIPISPLQHNNNNNSSLPNLQNNRNTNNKTHSMNFANAFSPQGTNNNPQQYQQNVQLNLQHLNQHQLSQQQQQHQQQHQHQQQYNHQQQQYNQQQHNQQQHNQQQLLTPKGQVQVNHFPETNNNMMNGDNEMMQNNLNQERVSSADFKSIDQTLERNGEFFNQLDAMIATVQVESTQLDTLREKLKELEDLRSQLSFLTRRLLEADQTNLTLKGNLVLIQEELASAKKSKTETEALIQSSLAPLRSELLRVKELESKERTSRVNAQRDAVHYKERFEQGQKEIESLKKLKGECLNLENQNTDLKKELSQAKKKQKINAAHNQKVHDLSKQSIDKLKTQIRSLGQQLLDVGNSINTDMLKSVTKENLYFESDDDIDDKSTLSNNSDNLSDADVIDEDMNSNDYDDDDDEDSYKHVAKVIADNSNKKRFNDSSRKSSGGSVKSDKGQLRQNFSRDKEEIKRGVIRRSSKRI